jgi:hypothetical protein
LSDEDFEDVVYELDPKLSDTEKERLRKAINTAWASYKVDLSLRDNPAGHKANMKRAASRAKRLAASLGKAERGGHRERVAAQKLASDLAQTCFELRVGFEPREFFRIAEIWAQKVLRDLCAERSQIANLDTARTLAGTMQELAKHVGTASGPQPGEAARNELRRLLDGIYWGMKHRALGPEDSLARRQLPEAADARDVWVLLVLGALGVGYPPHESHKAEFRAPFSR